VLTIFNFGGKQLMRSAIAAGQFLGTHRFL
jgi:hypothetical protein